MSIQEELNKSILTNVKRKFKVLIEQGLSLRGYTFKTNEELRNFIQKNCRAERNGNEIKYYVGNEVFLIFQENVELDFRPSEVAFVIEYGKIRFSKR